MTQQTESPNAYDIWWERFYDEHKETPTSYETWQAAQDELKAKLLSDEMVEVAAKALWGWRCEGRKNQILEIEWSLLRGDYLEQANAALETIAREL